VSRRKQLGIGDYEPLREKAKTSILIEIDDIPGSLHNVIQQPHNKCCNEISMYDSILLCRP